MSDVPQELRRISWSECFGFTQLFRAFRLAIHPTKLLLAFCGVLLTYGSGRLLDVVWPSSRQPAIVVVGDHAVSELDFFVQPERGGRTATAAWLETLGPSKDRRRAGAFELLLQHGRVTARQATEAAVAADVGGLVAAVRSGLMGVAWLGVMHAWYGVVFGLLTLVIWAFFGGALCRVAALHAARDERIGLRESLTFATKKFPSFLAAPLMPAALLALFAVALFLGGLLGAIPVVGEILVGITFFLALIGGFIMAFVVIGTMAGFSLTFPTVAIEGSDAFDALSRSFSYVYQRPWRSAFYGLVALAYGAICLVFVKFFVRIMLCTVHFFVGLSMNWGSPSVADASGQAANDLSKLDALWQGPSLAGESPFWGGFADAHLAFAGAFGQFCFSFWIFAVVGLVGAFIVSFYYSASTLIYLLLRREVDATDLEDVYLEEQPEDPSPPVEATEPPKQDEAGDSSPSEDKPTS